MKTLLALALILAACDGKHTQLAPGCANGPNKNDSTSPTGPSVAAPLVGTDGGTDDLAVAPDLADPPDLDPPADMTELPDLTSPPDMAMPTLGRWALCTPNQPPYCGGGYSCVQNPISGIWLCDVIH